MTARGDAAVLQRLIDARVSAGISWHWPTHIEARIGVGNMIKFKTCATLADAWTWLDEQARADYGPYYEP